MQFRARSGVTLVELLLYMTILSLVTIGVTQMVTEIQKANVQTINLADQFAESDLTMRRVQVKLGNSDDVEVVDLTKGTGDNACLRLKTYTQYTRKGVRFDGRNQYIRSGTSYNIPIAGSSPRTMSVWVRIDPDNLGLSTVAMWGNGARSEFGIDIRDGAPEIRLGCMSLRPQPKTISENGQTQTTPIDLRDGGWHHIAVTFADAGAAQLNSTSAKIYIDGKPVPTDVWNCGSSINHTVNTWRTPLYIGRHINDRQTSFKGLISDLRIWSRNLYPVEITELAQRDLAANENTSGMIVSLPLDNFNGYGLANLGTWQGAGNMRAFSMPQSDLVQSTLVDQTRYHSFCMIDDDGDGLHELWESATALTVPNRVGGDAHETRSRTWDKQSDDMFVPSPAGFFKVVGRAPESVIANFAVGKGIADSADLSQKAQSKPLATTRSKTQPELCAIDTKPLTIPRTCQNSFKEAYVLIENYIEGLHGKLDILNVTWTGHTNFQRAVNLPNMPPNVSATWHPNYGILKFASPEPIEDKYWQRAMAMTLYRPKGRSSDSTVTFSFAVGGLPYFKDSKYRFFRFIENDGSGDPGANQGDGGGEDNGGGGEDNGGGGEDNGGGGEDNGGGGEDNGGGGEDNGGGGEDNGGGGEDNGGGGEDNGGGGGTINAVAFHEAATLAFERSDACGLHSHLATISTEAEHDHLTKTMMLREVPGWLSGWIGAKVEGYNIFAWATGPVAERKSFWRGVGQNGRPYLTKNGQMSDQAGRTLFEYDPLPNFNGNRRRIIVQPNRYTESFLFTNWAGGKEYQPEDPQDYSCDSTSTNAPPAGCEPSTAQIGDGVAIYGHKNRNGTWFSVPNETQRCDPAREHSICGYYVEFVEPDGEAPMKFAHQVTLDMNRFREFCESEDNATR